MTTITITLDDSAAEKLRRIAVQRHVLVDDLLQMWIAELDNPSQDAGRIACNALDESFRLVSTPMGGKPWSNREELYDR